MRHKIVDGDNVRAQAYFVAKNATNAVCVHCRAVLVFVVTCKNAVCGFGRKEQNFSAFGRSVRREENRRFVNFDGWNDFCHCFESFVVIGIIPRYLYKYNSIKLVSKNFQFPNKTGGGPKKITILSLTIPTQFLVFSQNFFYFCKN